MSHPKRMASAALDANVSRRSWLAIAVSALTGCGGSGGVAGSPGTGGTGVYAQGSIAGFGSVIVNGIKFEDTAATVVVNGVTVLSSDLRLGMVAAVQGTRGADLTLGVASRIEVWSIAQGPVSQVQPGQFMVMGMVVQTDLNTAFEGISTTTDLVPEQTVVVWGLQAGADGQRWTATRVAALTYTAVVGSGMVAVSGTQRTLNGLVLAGPGASDLSAGQWVRAQGALSSSGAVLTVASARMLDFSSVANTQDETEVEGFVTTVLSSTRFMLGNTEVDARTATYVKGGIPIAPGMRIEVYGTWQGKVLQANKIDIESDSTPHEVEIQAPIDAFTSLANFVLRGQRCDATGAVVSGADVSSLKVGIAVKVKGTKSGAVLKVTSLDIGVQSDNQAKDRQLDR